MSEWSTEIPNEPGWYWFHGLVCGEWSRKEYQWDRDKPRPPLVPGFHIVRVRSCGANGNDRLKTMDHGFLSDYMPVLGHFIRVEPPVPPKELP